MLAFEAYLKGRRVAVTGHTGFTGGWLMLWLEALGADVWGLALEPETSPDLFTAADIEASTTSRIGDIRDPAVVDAFFTEAQPEIIFHLAAQPIVSVGYDDPRGTFDTNVMGTLNILEAARRTESVRAAVCVTTDKVYENREWCWGYREIDPLGGKDPYSASKSACEMVIRTYRDALAPIANGMAIAAARGGNIIGGGDWADNRIVPDFVRAATSNSKLVLRNPTATRPWQHVLALVHGYILLGSHMAASAEGASDAWNFGPGDDGAQSVGTLVGGLQKAWPGVDVELGTGAFKESHFLHLSSDKARSALGWVPALDFTETVQWTAEWYSAFHTANANARTLTQGQIAEYRRRLGAEA